MESIEVDIKCPKCKRRIKELNDDNTDEVTNSNQYVVYCECGEEILYEDNKK